MLKTKSVQHPVLRAALWVVLSIALVIGSFIGFAVWELRRIDVRWPTPSVADLTEGSPKLGVVDDYVTDASGSADVHSRVIVLRPGVTTKQVLTVWQQHGWKVYRATNGALSHDKRFCVTVKSRDDYLNGGFGRDPKAQAFVEKVAVDDRSVVIEGSSC